MKLSEVKPYYESSNDLQEHFFSVQDQGMIFDILRSKMYSNPILAICREISCNARDAHREVGKENTPIQIHLPTALEPYYTIKDFGPGISPDRMINIFIKYTASTKRNDNVQTGGFGLGAKTPFAYSDQFTVTTFHDGTKYSYACSIDETKVGKLILLDSRPTDEPNGTEISIPVKPVDFSVFRQYTEQSCRHWNVKPVILGDILKWAEFNPVIKGDDWIIIGTTNYHCVPRLVIDGIEYPLDTSSLRKYADASLIDSIRGDLILYFNVGELTLSANREQIFLDKSTQEKISKRLERISKDIKKLTEEKIAKFSNLWEANVFYRKELAFAFNSLTFLGKLYWKTCELNSNGYVNLSCPMFSFSRGKYSRKHGNDPNKITRSAIKTIYFDTATELYINDLTIKEPTPRHLKKAFEDNPALKNIIVICPNDKYPLDVLNKTYHLDEMQYKKLSSIVKTSGRNYTASLSRLLVFKYEGAGIFKQVSYSSIEEDKNDKVLCLLSRYDNYSNRTAILQSKSNKNIILNSYIIKSLLSKSKDISLYGIDADTDIKRIEKDFEDFQRFEDFIEETIFNDKSINYVEIKYAENFRPKIDHKFINIYKQVLPLINDPNSLFLKFVNLQQKIDCLSLNDKGLLDIYEAMHGSISSADVTKLIQDNPELDYEKMNKLFNDKYEFFKALNSYYMDPFVKEIANYVNMVDKN